MSAARPIVKVCGLTRPEDAEAAIAAGADWLGLNFWPGSKRCIDGERGRAVAEAARRARRDAVLVGVFVNEDPGRIASLAEALGLDYVQLHGDEPPEACARFGDRAIKAIPLGSAEDVERMEAYPCSVFLVDTPSPGYGGSGRAGDWELARAAAGGGRRVLLAGGLTPDNVGAALASVGPFGVDVASGVEASPGIKDADAMRRFVAAVRT